MFYEWSSVTKEVTKYKGYQQNDIVYYPFIDNKGLLKLQKCIIELIKYDSAAPREDWDSPKAICKKKKLLFFSEKVEVPFYLMSKNITEARTIFLKHNKYLNNIKILSNKDV